MYKRQFVHCKCPKCGKDARRETDTMPQWAGSSWYFLRYCDPNNDKEFASQEEKDNYKLVSTYTVDSESISSNWYSTNSAYLSLIHI